MKTSSFKDLIVWRKSFELARHVYKITETFPGSEKFGLVQQMRRSAISVPSNIAEGYGRKHNLEYERFLSIAYGSLLELETQYLLALELRFMGRDIFSGLLQEVSKMLYVMVYRKHKK